MSINTSSKRMIFAVTISDKQVLKTMNRLIHPIAWKGNSPKLNFRLKLSEKGLEWPMGPPVWPPEQRNEPSSTSFRRFLRLEVRAYRGFSDGF